MKQGWHIKLLFEPRDLWIGLYWKRTVGAFTTVTLEQSVFWTFFVCFVPMFPIRIDYVQVRDYEAYTKARHRQEKRWRRREGRTTEEPDFQDALRIWQRIGELNRH